MHQNTKTVLYIYWICWESISQSFANSIDLSNYKFLHVYVCLIDSRKERKVAKEEERERERQIWAKVWWEKVCVNFAIWLRKTHSNYTTCLGYQAYYYTHYFICMKVSKRTKNFSPCLITLFAFFYKTIMFSSAFQCHNFVHAKYQLFYSQNPRIDGNGFVVIIFFLFVELLLACSLYFTTVHFIDRQQI